MKLSVVVRGSGVAALCATHLLRLRGVACALEPSHRRPLPAVLLTQATQKLLEDVFRTKTLFEGLHRIERRVVAWGDDAEPVTVPHTALALEEADLIARLSDRLAGQTAPQTEPAWIVQSFRNPNQQQHDHSFGSRPAVLTSVTLTPGSDSSACFVESLEAGWLFLLSLGGRKATLIAVGGAPEKLLARSRLVAPQIAHIASTGSAAPSHPRIVSPVCGANWLACGSAAIAFDPLCGEGTGNAVREAILAAALIGANANGEAAGPLTVEYEARLLGAFLRHLQICRQFYKSGGSGEWWKNQIEPLNEGIAWCNGQLERKPRPQFRLVGFDLIAIGP